MADEGAGRSRGAAGPPRSADPWQAPRTRAGALAFAQLKARGFAGTEEDVRKALEEGPEGKADLALPLFRWAKGLGKRPDELARDVAAAIAPEVLEAGGGLARVSAESGFVNFHLDPRGFAASTLSDILGAGAAYGQGPPRQGRVCVEHTSANPTGPLHVGRSRNTVIGDTYARVLRAAGWPVVTQFYVDDVGRQASMLVWIWSKPVAQWPPQIRERSNLPTDGARPKGVKADHWYGRAYPPTAEYVKEHEEAAADLRALSERVEHGKIAPAEYRRIPQEILDGILASLERIGAGFDEFVWESDFILDGSVDRALARVRNSSRYQRTDDGAEGVEGTDMGLPKEAPLVFVTRADGTNLYPARDLAYHLQKLERFDRVIDVLGEDHKLHIRGIMALLDAAGEKRRPEVLVYGFINLPEGRMTTRGGRVVHLDDVLDRARELALEEVRKRRPDLASAEAERIAESVGAGAVRFHILKVQPEKPIVFQWDEALSFEGKSAPFVQYAHARAASLLRKAVGSDEGAALRPPPPELAALPQALDPKEVALVRVLSQLPALVEKVSESGSVHLMAVYAHEVAERLNEFYQAVRVLDGEERARPFRVALVAASRQVLSNTLGLIGVEALERM